MRNLADGRRRLALRLAADRVALEAAARRLLLAGAVPDGARPRGRAARAAALGGVVGGDRAALLVLLAGVLGGVAHRRVIRTGEGRGLGVLVLGRRRRRPLGVGHDEHG